MNDDTRRTRTRLRDAIGDRGDGDKQLLLDALAFIQQLDSHIAQLARQLPVIQREYRAWRDANDRIERSASAITAGAAPKAELVFGMIRVSISAANA